MDNSKKANGNNNVNLEELKENNLVVKNQKRFVLFVGNIPYDTNKLDLIEHFKKSGEIKHIRIPTEKKTSKPRGFAYVELANEETYQVKIYFAICNVHFLESFINVAVGTFI